MRSTFYWWAVKHAHRWAAAEVSAVLNITGQGQQCSGRDTWHRAKMAHLRSSGNHEEELQAGVVPDETGQNVSCQRSNTRGSAGRNHTAVVSARGCPAGRGR